MVVLSISLYIHIIYKLNTKRLQMSTTQERLYNAR
nr:MAG TPA: hypothetical protein [Caudoviricetes sp.]